MTSFIEIATEKEVELKNRYNSVFSKKDREDILS